MQGKARSDMTVEERIGAADRRKMDGNSLFKEEKLEEAMQQYEMVMHLPLSLSKNYGQSFGFQAYLATVLEALVSSFGF